MTTPTYNSSVDIQLGQVPTVDDPQVEALFRELYNTIQILANTIEELKERVEALE